MSRKLPHLFDFKSGNVNLLHFELHSNNLQQIEHELHNRLKETPDFFANDPIVIDVRSLNNWKNLDIIALQHILETFKIRSLAIIVDKQQYQWAASSRLSVIIESESRRPLNHSKQVDSNAILPAHFANISHNNGYEFAPMRAQSATNLTLFDDLSFSLTDIKNADGHLHSVKELVSDDIGKSFIEDSLAQKKQMNTVFIDKPMRSGQRIYAAGNVVVLGAVNHGAEIIAEGDIHIYAPLRGRALAGVKGNDAARIFCTCLDPELISIAGIYRTAENRLPDDIRNCASQVKLVGETLFFEPLAMS